MKPKHNGTAAAWLGTLLRLFGLATWWRNRRAREPKPEGKETSAEVALVGDHEVSVATRQWVENGLPALQVSGAKTALSAVPPVGGTNALSAVELLEINFEVYVESYVNRHKGCAVYGCCRCRPENCGGAQSLAWLRQAALKQQRKEVTRILAIRDELLEELTPGTPGYKAVLARYDAELAQYGTGAADPHVPPRPPDPVEDAQQLAQETEYKTQFLAELERKARRSLEEVARTHGTDSDVYQHAANAWSAALTRAATEGDDE